MLCNNFTKIMIIVRSNDVLFQGFDVLGVSEKQWNPVDRTTVGPGKFGCNNRVVRLP